MCLSLVAYSFELTLKIEFDPRNGEEHRHRCFQEKALETQDEHHTFFDEHGVRWTELARLPYFDLVRQTIIDPMHNLLLGVSLYFTILP